MKDKIISGYLKDFCDQLNIQDADEAELFETFCNYCIISNDHPGYFDLEDVSTGGGNDTAIDGLAISVNENIVTSKEQIESLINKMRRLDASFIFIQSKTSAKFDSGEMNNFIFGVKDFFKDEGSLIANDKIQFCRELKDSIYDKSIDMNEPPRCELYYVTTGKWMEDKNIRSVIDMGVKELKATNLFSDVVFTPVDATLIGSLYKNIRRKTSKVIHFDRYATIPEIDGVDSAYLGIVSGRDYITMIENDEGNINKALFLDNVRDYQGENTVNLEIIQTLREKKNRDMFALLNNGITIVAKSIIPVGDKFKINDFQIVNGCQTSHVLYSQKDNLDKETSLPVKIIATNNQSIINQIIKATNRQTPVLIEAFESLTPFHKELEEFYTASRKNNKRKIYYERRSKQYQYEDIKRYQIITFPIQINCVISMFLDSPHSTHRYYGELLKANSKRIFLDDHKFDPYYTSTYTLNFVEDYLKKKRFRKYLKFKYHIILLIRLFICGNSPSPLSSKKTVKCCEDIIKCIDDKKIASRLVEEAISAIDAAQAKYKGKNTEIARVKYFTEMLLGSADILR